MDRRLALAIIDVDFFKRINDELGHEAGDNAIKWIAGKLRAAFSIAACIGRLGGDEFAVVLEVKNSDATKAQFENFCAEVAAEPISWYPAGMTISIGVAIAKQAGVSARELLTNADRAMYSSKQQGETWLPWSRSINQQKQPSACRTPTADWFSNCVVTGND